LTILTLFIPLCTHLLKFDCGLFLHPHCQTIGHAFPPTHPFLDLSVSQPPSPQTRASPSPSRFSESISSLPLLVFSHTNGVRAVFCRLSLFLPFFVRSRAVVLAIPVLSGFGHVFPQFCWTLVPRQPPCNCLLAIRPLQEGFVPLFLVLKPVCEVSSCFCRPWCTVFFNSLFFHLCFLGLKRFFREL